MSSTQKLGETLFRLRDYTVIPLFVLMLFVAKPSPQSACIGTLVVLFGELVRLYSVAFIGTISRTRSRSLGEKLVQEGPFSMVRNPLYVGNFFIVLGLCIFCANSLLLFVTVGYFAFQYYYIVAFEEYNLEQKFGEEFASYKKSVPPWVPKSMSSWKELPNPGEWLPALKSEKSTFSAIFGTLFLLMILA